MNWLWVIPILLFLIFIGTRFPIKDDVMMYCPDCHAYVWCSRTVYPDKVYYTCNRHHHHFSHEPSSHIKGDKQIPPPTGYDEDDK